MASSVRPDPSQDLAAALERIGLADIHAVLVKNDVDLASLAQLTEDDLRELELSLGQRKRVLRAQALLRAPAASPSQPVVAERRQITVLFCDLVGSTRLATRLDPEDLRDVIAAYHAACHAAIRRHHGHLAYSQGDGLMVYFGFPTAGEDDPERAIRAALDLSRSIAALDTAAPEPLRVRLGVATGIVVVGDLGATASREEMVLGQAPNLAARLQEVAGPGEIVVSATTRRLAGGLFDYAPQGVLTLKGFAEPVPAYRVLGEGRVDNRFDARRREGMSPMVGREAELARLHDLWRVAAGGEGRVVFVRGEAGLGKSRLVRAFIDLIADDRPLRLHWNCAAHLANHPLHPVAREVERGFGIERDAPAAVRLDRLARTMDAHAALTQSDLPYLAELIGLAGEDRHAIDAATRARRLHDVLARGVLGFAADRPVLAVLEDAHWADPATLDFVAHLIERMAQARVMMLVTTRPEFEPPWGEAAGHEILALTRLDGAACSRLVGAIAFDGGLPATVVRRIVEKADGVPLFVEELTKTVIDAVEELDDAALAAGLAIPETLSDSLMARLDRLQGAKATAQLAAVLGREFTLDMLRIAAPERTDIAGDLERLCESGLVRRGDAGLYAFHHALIQDAAYESLLKKRRREVHGLVAQAMLVGAPAFAGAEPESIARHCSVAGLGAEAVAHWIAAGRHALDRAANLAALHHLRAAVAELDLLPQSEQRTRFELEIQMMLAATSMTIFGWASTEVEAACVRARDLAAATGDGESLFGANWGLWTTLFLRGELERAIVVAHDVDAMAEAAGGPMLAVAAAHAVGYTRFYRGEFAEALTRAERSIAGFDLEIETQITRAFQLSSTLALWSARTGSLWMLGREAEAGESLDGMLRLADEIGHLPSLAYALGAVGHRLTTQRDWRRLGEIAARNKALSEAEGYRLWHAVAELQIGLAEAFTGKRDAGLEAAERGRQRFLATRTALTDALYQPALGELLIATGRPELAVARLDAAIPDAERRAERMYLPELYRIRGLARLDVGDAAGGCDDLRAARDLALAQGAVPLIALADASLASLHGPRRGPDVARECSTSS